MEAVQAGGLWVLGALVRVLVDGARTGGRYAVIEVGAPADERSGPPPHIHTDCDESFQVLEGELEVLAGGAWRTLKAGEVAIVPKGTVHTFRNRSGRACVFLSAFTPAGFEEFFRYVGTDAAGHPGATLERPVVPTGEDVQKVLGCLERFKMVMVG